VSPVLARSVRHRPQRVGGLGRGRCPQHQAAAAVGVDTQRTIGVRIHQPTARVAALVDAIEVAGEDRRRIDAPAQRRILDAVVEQLAARESGERDLSHVGHRQVAVQGAGPGEGLRAGVMHVQRDAQVPADPDVELDAEVVGPPAARLGVVGQRGLVDREHRAGRAVVFGPRCHQLPDPLAQQSVPRRLG